MGLFGLSPAELLLLAAGGTAIAMSGGTAAPVLSGAVPALTGAGTGATALEGAGMLSAQAPALTGVEGAGMLGKVGSFAKSVGEYAKPVMQVGQAAQLAKSFMPEPEKSIQGMPITPPTPSTNLPQLVQQNQDIDMQRQQQEMERRMMQRQRTAQLGRF